MLPPALYKYTTSQTALKILNSGRLRWSSPLCFNDVTEFKRMPRFEPSLSNGIEMLKSILLEHVYLSPRLDESRLSKQANELRVAIEMLRSSGLSYEDASGFLKSLSTPVRDPDEHYEATFSKWWESELLLQQARVLCVTVDPCIDAMWGNYGEEGRGIVLGFRHIPELSTALLAAQQVTYGDEQPVVGSGLEFLLYGESADLLTRTRQSVVYHKRSSWSYEQEWRCVTWRRDEGDSLFGDYPFLAEELDSVTFGARCSDDDRLRALDVMRQSYPNATAWTIRVKNGALVRELLPS